MLWLAFLCGLGGRRPFCVSSVHCIAGSPGPTVGPQDVASCLVAAVSEFFSCSASGSWALALSALDAFIQVIEGWNL